MEPFPNYRVGSHLAFLSKQYSKPKTNLLKQTQKFRLHQCFETSPAQIKGVLKLQYHYQDRASPNYVCYISHVG